MLRSCSTGLSPTWQQALGPALTGIACRTPSRSGWAARRWRGGVCDPSATSSAVLLRSWVVPQIQFLDRVDGVRDGVLLVLPSGFHKDRYPQCFSWSSMSWERGCSMEACERISHIFYVLLALFAWNLDLISFEPLVSGSHLSLCVATVHGCSWTNFVFFYVKSGLGSPCSSHLEIGNYFYEQYLAVSACVSLRCFWKNFTFSTCWLSRFLAQFEFENLDIISTCSHLAVGGFFRRL